MAAVGDALARVHIASEGFVVEGGDRFDAASLRHRLDGVSLDAHPALAPAVARIRVVPHAPAPTDLPRGIVHGDLFRDNVRWEGDTLLALLDWESASSGVLLFDVAVVLLAWCWATTSSGPSPAPSRRPTTARGASPTPNAAASGPWRRPRARASLPRASPTSISAEARSRRDPRTIDASSRASTRCRTWARASSPHASSTGSALT